jgi:hypothetical protein
VFVLALLLGSISMAGSPVDDPEAPMAPPRRPDLTDPIVCHSVRGFREFVPRDEPELTRDEKLQVYYEPFNFTIVRQKDGPRFRAHLTQDIRIRRAGADRPLQERKGVIDYSPESDDPPSSFYMFTTLELKQLPAGSYVLDLILRDELGQDKPETVQTVPFRVVSAPPQGSDDR